MHYRIHDLRLAPDGRLKVEWASARMPVMKKLRELYEREKPFAGWRIGGCLHITKETAVLVNTLRATGAETTWCGCNPLSTQDDVAAALADDGVQVYGWRNLSHDEYYWCIDRVIRSKPDLTLDDGADLVIALHGKHPGLADAIVGGTEETTTGVHRIQALARRGKLRYPVIAVNNAETKWDFDNVYGTGQSALDGIVRATNLLLAGSTFVVAGYGHCGHGVAQRARGMGARVIVSEVDAICALKAAMDGFAVMSMKNASRIGDVFVTATGCKDVIAGEHFDVMKNGAILANAGHFNVEISVSQLEEMAVSKRQIRPNNVEYTLKGGRRLHLLAEGRLVNLAAAEGHPPEVMDMSFANQFLSLLKLTRAGKKLKPKVYPVAAAQDRDVAEIKLRTMGLSVDRLTAEQRKYLRGYTTGT